MPAWLIPIVWGVITALLDSVIARILSALGVGSVTFFGVNFVMSKVRSALMGMTSGFGSDAMNILGMSGLGVCISIILSAFTIRMTLNGIDKAGNFSSIKFSGFGGGE
ncbi:DUF2523 domain-containing protein [Chromobacterium haemolyticum]|uniref:DUF2523 domain-containing protein n=1 Tax=Chromobacterium haemolyticum TaxID=394935 RepID=UPI000D3031A2|nr:DUF2523 domain-containing protein [Chromobacterium haemolyticum]PTU69233.1 hypothetical protein DBB33_07155 [Chromobacterium haemolyticum]